MKKPLDRITEAYFNEMGHKFGERVRRRIHWICSQTKGEKVLDVGCSQGITSILLAREGKEVLGLDLLEEAIDYANKMLDKESDITKSYVEFKHANFITYDFGDQRFDSIIFGEVLEHITDPERFIQNASHLLTENGRIIVTVPFGINDYFDHKKTYYLKGLLDLQLDGLSISDVEFLEGWIGAVFTKSDARLDMDSELFKRLEDSFYFIERKLTKRLQNLQAELDKLKSVDEANQELLKSKSNEIEQIERSLVELQQSNSSLQEENEELKIALEKWKTDHQEKELEIEDKEFEIEEKNLLIETLNAELKEKEELQQRFTDDKVSLERKIEGLMDELNTHRKNTSDEMLKKDKRNIFLEKKLTETRKEVYALKKELRQAKEQQKAATSKNTEVEPKLVENLRKRLILEKKEKVKANEQLLEAYTKEERLLKSHSQLMKRYEALKNSKLGKLTINYWKWRSRRRLGGKVRESTNN